MLPIVLNAMTPRSPIPANIKTVNSKKHFGSNEFPIVAKQQSQEKDELRQGLKKYKIGWFEFQTELIWFNIFFMSAMHIGIVYTLLTGRFYNQKMLVLWVWIVGGIGGFGVTGGVHRYWTHRTYKAKLPLRIILLVCYITAGENSIFNWVRDHRVHHKHSETDADPHNSNRGLFFSHMGWLMMRKHPEVLRRGKEINMSDILSDPLVQFAEKHFSVLKLLICFVIPILIPVYCWNADWYMTIMTQLFIRYPLTLHSTWAVNSFAHFWGYRSYDKSIRPAENLVVSYLAMGEGWHNYHHTFPWDYKAAEIGNFKINVTTIIIEGFAKIGWAYDLKQASDGLVRKVVENRGDGTHLAWGKDEE